VYREIAFWRYQIGIFVVFAQNNPALRKKDLKHQLKFMFAAINYFFLCCAK